MAKEKQSKKKPINQQNRSFFIHDTKDCFRLCGKLETRQRPKGRQVLKFNKIFTDKTT